MTVTGVLNPRNLLSLPYFIQKLRHSTGLNAYTERIVLWLQCIDHGETALAMAK